MKTKEELQSAVDEIREVCRKHGVVLIGTCSSEMIYGEITIADNSEDPGWLDADKMIDNTVLSDSDGCCHSVGGIGDLKGG